MHLSAKFKGGTIHLPVVGVEADDVVLTLLLEHEEMGDLENRLGARSKEEVEAAFAGPLGSKALAQAHSGLDHFLGVTFTADNEPYAIECVSCQVTLALLVDP